MSRRRLCTKPARRLRCPPAHKQAPRTTTSLVHTRVHRNLVSYPQGYTCKLAMCGPSGVREWTVVCRCSLAASREKGGAGDAAGCRRPSTQGEEARGAGGRCWLLLGRGRVQTRKWRWQETGLGGARRCGYGSVVGRRCRRSCGVSVRKKMFACLIVYSREVEPRIHQLPFPATLPSPWSAGPPFPLPTGFFVGLFLFFCPTPTHPSLMPVSDSEGKITGLCYSATISLHDAC